MLVAFVEKKEDFQDLFCLEDKAIKKGFMQYDHIPYFSFCLL